MRRSRLRWRSISGNSEKLALVCQEKELHFYVPGLPERFQNKIWGKSYRSLDEALAGALSGLPEGARVAVIPEGPYVLARVEEAVPA